MAEYETIKAQNDRIWIEDETFENKIIEFDGKWAQLQLRGDATVRNVAFTGTHRYDEHCIIVNGSGDVTIENVYLGDGCIRPAQYSSHGQCGLFVHREFSGHVDIRNVNVQEWPNNGMYTNPPYYEGGGTVHIDNCYAANNYVSNFRIGSSGSKLTNSVSLNTSNGRFRGRCAWLWGKDVEVSGCQMDSGGYGNDTAIWVRDATEVSIADTVHDGIALESPGRGSVNGHRRINNSAINALKSDGVVDGDPDLSPPEGVPMTAVEAASGEKPPQWDREHVYELENHGDSAAEYYLEAEDGAEFEVSDFDDADEPEKWWVSEDGNRAAGILPPGERHAWEFSTLLLNVDVEPVDDVTLRVDRQPSDLSRYPRGGASEEQWMNDEVDIDVGDDLDDGDEGEDDDRDGDRSPDDELEELRQQLEAKEKQIESAREALEGSSSVTALEALSEG